MHLPSNVPKYHADVYLISFDLHEYVIAVRPTGATLEAWSKLEETERRVWYFDWLTHFVRDQRGNTRIVQDFAAAYLHSYEATLQVIQDELFPRNRQRFFQWLVSQPSYDHTVRGLRTMRHLEAHIRYKPVTAPVGRTVVSRYASGGDPGRTIAWQFPEASSQEFSRLRAPALDAAEVPDWNARVGATPAAELMRDGLGRLKRIVAAAEGPPHAS